MIEFEKFEKVLKSAGGATLEGQSFNRRIQLNSFGTIIIFEWFTNCCNAYVNDIQICGYDNITVNGHWPNSYKNNINLKIGSETIAVIPIEKY